MRYLGTLGGTNSYGYNVNNAGQVAGQSQITGSSVTHAFRYDGTPGSGGVMRDLGTLGGTSSEGYGVNNAGQVAGRSHITGFEAYHAFRYDGTSGAGGIMRDLGTLGGTDSHGRGINDTGQVAGYSHIPGNTAQHAFRYDGTPGAGGIMRDLGTLGGGYSEGFGVNEAGQVAGYSFINGHDLHAFRYDGTPGAGGIMRDLGTLGGSYSYGFDVNDAGQVAGFSYLTGNTAAHAFLYTGTPGTDGQMLDLDTWLDANNPAEGSKWTLLEARGVSMTGWITGGGIYDPDGPGGVAAAGRAYLLDASSLVPEPSGLTACMLAVPALLRRRHQSRQRQAIGRACCQVLEGRRLLSFTAAVNYPAGQVAGAPQAIVTADFNKDGRLDLATANPGRNSVSVLLGNGAGGFGAAINSAGTTNDAFERASVTVADFNKDGRPDLATAMFGYYEYGYFGRLDVRLGNGDGTFQSPTLVSGGGLLAVAAGDFNNDTKSDLLYVADFDGQQAFAQVLFGNGLGGFTTSGSGVGSNYNDGLAVGDLNGDGNFDAVAYGDGFVHAYQGNGRGGLAVASYFYPTSGALALAIAEFTRDGIPDLVVSGGAVEIYRGHGDGTFDEPIVHSANGSEHTGVAVADFNGDGKFDVVTSDGDIGTVSLLLGNGDGTLRYAGAFPAGSSPSGVVVGDFNRDGRPDVAVSNAGSNNVSVLLNSTDNVGPTIGAAQFPYLLAPHRITIPFSEPVAPSLSLPDITVQNMTTATTVNPLSMSYDVATNTATFSFAGVLPDGNYRASIAAANVTDLDGNPLVAHFAFDFFVLAGDADRDRDIDINDLGVLATNWQRTNKTFSDGDFDYNGTVDVNDLGILATQWQQTLAFSSAPTLSPEARRRAPSRIIEDVI
jgi:probable HAF family extracellular repeat protein